MTKASRNLSRSELTALIIIAVVAFPSFMAFDWLKIHQPILALIVRGLVYLFMTSFFALCAWLLWRATLNPLSWPANQYARTISERLGIVMRRLGALYGAIMSSIALILCLVSLARLVIEAI